jgi:hypothetical protein
MGNKYGLSRYAALIGIYNTLRRLLDSGPIGEGRQ